MSNNILDINGNGILLLTKTLELVFKKMDVVTVSGWHETPQHGLLVYWGGDQHGDMERFGPAGVSPKTLADMANSWLQKINYDNFETDPRCQKRDIDGDILKGWQVTLEPTEMEGIPHRDYLVCVIRPAWIYRHK